MKYLTREVNYNCLEYLLICTDSTKCRLLVAPSKLKGIHSFLARDLKYEMHWIFCCPRQLTCSAFTIRVALSTTQGSFAALATVTVTTMGSITLFKQILVWQVGVCDGNETSHTVCDVTEMVGLRKMELPRHPFMLLTLALSSSFSKLLG